MNRTKEYQDKYFHFYKLFKFGRDVEIDLEKKLELARDELERIKVLCNQKPEKQILEEIEGLCNRGLDMTESN